MIKLNRIYLITIIGLIFPLFLQCERKADDIVFCSDADKGFLFYPSHNLLRLACLTDSDVVPDSILMKQYKVLYIECPQLTRYQNILDRLNPTNIETILINNYDAKHCFSEDLSRFKNLRKLTIRGTEFRTIVFKGHIDTFLEDLIIQSVNLDFPEFDSSLLDLKNLHYYGTSEVIPKWIEELDSLEHLTFQSKHLRGIQSDICKMSAIKIFDISESDLYENEMTYNKRTGRFNLLEQYKICKPFINFFYRLPPK